MTVEFKVVGRAGAQGGVAAAEAEVSIEVVGHFQPGFFEQGKREGGRQVEVVHLDQTV